MWENIVNFFWIEEADNKDILNWYNWKWAVNKPDNIKTWRNPNYQEFFLRQYMYEFENKEYWATVQ